MKIVFDLGDEQSEIIGLEPRLADMFARGATNTTEIMLNAGRALFLQAAREIKARGCPCENCRLGIAALENALNGLARVFDEDARKRMH
jgi:hypothetical protein